MTGRRATYPSDLTDEQWAVVGPFGAKDVCLALGLGVTAKDTEGLRAKLKRLVTRQILIEAEPGVFTLAPATSA